MQTSTLVGKFISVSPENIAIVLEDNIILLCYLL